MALTPIDTVTHDLVVPFDDNLIFTFQLTPIPGVEYQAIIEEHRDDEGKASNDQVAAPMMAAGISQAYSSVDSVATDFTYDDAELIWNTWPDWARWAVYNGVVAYSTAGKVADPFAKSNRKGTDER